MNDLDRGSRGKMNLFFAGHYHLMGFTDRSVALAGIFRSLLYEACGRIVNPIYGSVGLLWSGSWHLCQAAVESVLKGAPITPITSEAAVTSDGPPLKVYDIRHVSKDENSAAFKDLHRAKTRCRFKRSGAKPKPSCAAVAKPKASPEAEPNRSTSHDSSLSHESEPAANLEGDSKETESMVSEETAEPSPLFRAEGETTPAQTEEVRRGSEDIGLELTLGLGFEPVARPAAHVVPVKKRRFEECASTDSGGGAFKGGLRL